MENRFHIDTEDPTPIYAQLERAIRFAIATEKLRVGEQLPTVRQLAIDLKINANTVARVYAELERGGILETRRGVGTFVRARQDGVLTRASKQSRERELRAFADRILAEAYELGFSPDEVIDHLNGRGAKAQKEDEHHGFSDN
jgi:GntR family transcriptional regulator